MFHFGTVSHVITDFLPLWTLSLLLETGVLLSSVSLLLSATVLDFFCVFVCLPFSWRAALWPHVRRCDIVSSWVLQRHASWHPSGRPGVLPLSLSPICGPKANLSHLHCGCWPLATDSGRVERPQRSGCCRWCLCQRRLKSTSDAA